MRTWIIVLIVGLGVTLNTVRLSLAQPAYLVEVTRYSEGPITGVHWLTPDTIAVSKLGGLWFYYADDLTQPPEFLNDHTLLTPTITQANQQLYFWRFDRGRARFNWNYPFFPLNSTWIYGESLQAAGHDGFGNALLYRFGRQSAQVTTLPILPSKNYQNAWIDLALSPTGEHLAVAYYEILCMEGTYSSFGLWDLETHTSRIDLSTSLEDTIRFQAMQFTSDGTGFGVIAQTLDAAQVRLWELKSGEAVEIPPLGAFDRLNRFRFVSNREQVVVFGPTDQLIRIFDLEGQVIPHTIPQLDGSVSGVDFSPDGSKLVITRTGVDLNTIQIGDYVESDGAIQYRNPITLTGRHHAFNPTMEQIVTSNDRDLQLWQLDGTPIAEIALPVTVIPPIMDNLQFEPPSALLSSLPDTIPAEIPPPYELGGVRWSPDGTRAALILNSELGCAESQDHRIALWQGDQSLWEVQSTFGDRLSNVLFTPDGALLIAIHERSVVLLDAATGDRLASFEAQIQAANLDNSGRFLRLQTYQGETILLMLVLS